MVMKLRIVRVMTHGCVTVPYVKSSFAMIHRHTDASKKMRSFGHVMIWLTSSSYDIAAEVRDADVPKLW